jgi:SAM-dependent methyltransferase
MRWTIGEERPDGRWHAPSADRNQAPILGVLKRVLPLRGRVLEIGSGTGQHVALFAKEFPRLAWQPSDADAGFQRSIALWSQAEGVTNVAPPLHFDVRDLPWPVVAVDAVVCINVIHVAPWEVAEALFIGARSVLAPGGVLFLYGPYRCAGRPTAPSNERFDAVLRAHDPQWGLRGVEEVVEVAERNGFACTERIDMPANNLSLVFHRR